MDRFPRSTDIKVVSAQLLRSMLSALVVRYLHQCKPEPLFFTSLDAAVFKDTAPSPRDDPYYVVHQSNSSLIAPSHQSRAGDGFTKAKLMLEGGAPIVYRLVRKFSCMRKRRSCAACVVHSQFLGLIMVVWPSLV